MFKARWLTSIFVEMLLVVSSWQLLMLWHWHWLVTSVGVWHTTERTDGRAGGARWVVPWWRWCRVPGGRCTDCGARHRAGSCQTRWEGAKSIRNGGIWDQAARTGREPASRLKHSKQVTNLLPTTAQNLFSVRITKHRRSHSWSSSRRYLIHWYRSSNHINIYKWNIFWLYSQIFPPFPTNIWPPGLRANNGCNEEAKQMIMTRPWPGPDLPCCSTDWVGIFTGAGPPVRIVTTTSLTSGTLWWSSST